MQVEFRECPICWTSFQVNRNAAARHTYCTPAAKQRPLGADAANATKSPTPLKANR
ncbi:hypothetical protein OHT57_00355 [Streptomyces sp. NBC_00285]|uniref:hypothetical protein n=1 Tax=Streptomyces sp. NBC_00285 TaxID=2975700 RepID=UPI002E2E263E|nr:hypothetical protein [Streptomyces sp. NBC_00285]